MFLKKFLSLLIFAVILIPTVGLATEKPKVAVIPFEDKSPKNGVVLENDMDTIRHDIVEVYLEQTKRFRFATRTEVDKLMMLISHDENNSFVDSEDVVESGKMFGVHYLVMGTVNGFKSKKKGDYTAYFSVRMIEVETAEIVYSGSGEGKSDENMLVALRKAAIDAMNGKRGMLTMMRGRK